MGGEARLPAPPDVLASSEPTQRDPRDGTPRAEPAHQLQAAAGGPAEVAEGPVEVRRARDLQGRGEAPGRQGRVAELAPEAGPYRRGRPVVLDRGGQSGRKGPEKPR